MVRNFLKLFSQFSIFFSQLIPFIEKIFKNTIPTLHGLLHNSIIKIKNKYRMLDTKQKKNTERLCSNPECLELGVYPAPKSRDKLREYLYFCINCIRDFNKSWNYFEGLNEQELEVEIRKSVTWDRPSWKFGTKNINYDFEEAFNKFENTKNINNKKLLNKKLENAFRVLGLSHDTNIKEVKTKYKFLAKKWHPDVQCENKSKNNKDKFINITNAYKIILESLTKPAKT